MDRKNGNDLFERKVRFTPLSLSLSLAIKAVDIGCIIHVMDPCTPESGWKRGGIGTLSMADRKG